MNIQEAFNILTNLPPNKQNEVFNFIQFIANNLPTYQLKKPPPLREEPALGLWAGREDMLDSTEWVKQLRNREWEQPK